VKIGRNGVPTEARLCKRFPPMPPKYSLVARWTCVSMGRRGDSPAEPEIDGQLTSPLLVGRTYRFSEQTMSRISSLVLIAILALVAAACGETPGTRALTGGAIGAAGGAAVGAAAGNPAAGAIVGGLGGAAVGAATTPRRY
jgi:osmotically inducible lipoprotein OsmB